MGIYNQARRWAVAVACTAGAVAGLSAVAPGAASAACITGSGSSLQAEQQTLWTGAFTNACGIPAVEYGATSSGKGLKEFGIEGTELKKAESFNGTKLDAFVGTDDAPLGTELTKTEGAAPEAGTKAWVAPIVAAPIAVIVHLPSGCSITKTITVTPAHLSEAFAASGITWETLLGSSNVSGSCTGKPMRDVRSDASGTSFAFKQYLCQVDGVTWGSGAGKCESGEGLVTDAATWPNETTELLLEHGSKIENKGSGGEVEAVEGEENAIGYVNLANAAKGGFVLSKNGTNLFWVKVETSSVGENPEKGTKEGNCPTSLELPTSPVNVESEAKNGEWAKVHLASTSTSGAYPICTLTYDIGWKSYATAKLETEYGNKGAAVGGLAREYFEYMTSTALGKGQLNIHEYYSPLPTGTKSVQEIAEEIALNHINK